MSNVIRRFSPAPAAVRTAPPRRGEHPDGVRAEAGSPAGEIDGLRRAGVVG